ncbi:armadillo-type protein [Ochromonadaceae sp. CCMP2298]|nr:armadillo-type protein [Ochromonadaceae sp. CCMP2298]
MRSKSIDVQREAARALANISAEYTYAPVIVAAGTLQSLVSAMSSPDFLCQRYAAMGVGNLACHPSNQKKIMLEGALPSLLSIARFENGDLESQRYATIALTNLSGTKANHSVLVDTGCLGMFVEFLDHHDVEIRNTAAFAIANLASNPNNHQIILKERALAR